MPKKWQQKKALTTSLQIGHGSFFLRIVEIPKVSCKNSIGRCFPTLRRPLLDFQTGLFEPLQFGDVEPVGARVSRDELQLKTS